MQLSDLRNEFFWTLALKVFSHRSHSYSPFAFNMYCPGSGSSSWIENWFGSKPILSVVSVSLYPAGAKLSSFPLSLNPSSRMPFFSVIPSCTFSCILFASVILLIFSLQTSQVKSVGAFQISASKKSKWISVVFLQWMHLFSFEIFFSWSFLWSSKQYEKRCWIKQASGYQKHKVCNNIIYRKLF